MRAAIEGAGTWAEALGRLGVADASVTTLKAHAARLGIEAQHLAARPLGSDERGLRPDTANLSRAGSLLAAAWFAMCGHDVAWPLEPSRFDLPVSSAEGIRRVQVKTTTAKAGNSWKVYLSTSGGGRRVYGLDEVDDFFIIDGDLSCYLIPVRVVGGLQAVHLRSYGRYRLVGGALAMSAQKVGL